MIQRLKDTFFPNHLVKMNEIIDKVNQIEDGYNRWFKSQETAPLVSDVSKTSARPDVFCKLENCQALHKDDICNHEYQGEYPPIPKCWKCGKVKDD